MVVIGFVLSSIAAFAETPASNNGIVSSPINAPTDSSNNNAVPNAAIPTDQQAGTLGSQFPNTNPSTNPSSNPAINSNDDTLSRQRSGSIDNFGNSGNNPSTGSLPGTSSGTAGTSTSGSGMSH